MALTIKRPESRVPFCLDGNLKAEHEVAHAKFEASRNQSLGDSRLIDPSRELAKIVNDIEKKMRASSVEFLLRGLPRGEWNELVNKHEPRPGNALDKNYGFNLEALMTPAIPACIVEVTNHSGKVLDFDVAKEWEALAKDMTDAQYEDFVMAVIRLNLGRNEIPFSLSAFRMIQNSDQK